MATTIYLLMSVLFLFNQQIQACEHGDDKVIVKSYNNVDDYKATFIETSAPSFNSDLSGFAKIIFLTEGQVPQICVGTFGMSDLEGKNYIYRFLALIKRFNIFFYCSASNELHGSL